MNNRATNRLTADVRVCALPHDRYVPGYPESSTFSILDPLKDDCFLSWLRGTKSVPFIIEANATSLRARLFREERLRQDANGG